MEVYSVCQCPSGHWRKFTDPDNALIVVYCLSVNWWKFTLVVRALAEVCSVHMCTGRIVTLPAHELSESYSAPASVLTKVYSTYPCSGESFILFVSARKKVCFDCPEFFYFDPPVPLLIKEVFVVFSHAPTEAYSASPCIDISSLCRSFHWSITPTVHTLIDLYSTHLHKLFTPPACALLEVFYSSHLQCAVIRSKYGTWMNVDRPWV